MDIINISDFTDIQQSSGYYNDWILDINYKIPKNHFSIKLTSDFDILMNSYATTIINDEINLKFAVRMNSVKSVYLSKVGFPTIILTGFNEVI